MLQSRRSTVGSSGAIALTLTVACAVLLCCFAVGARADETLYACGSYPNNVFYESDAVGFEEYETCGQVNGTMQIYTSSSPANGADPYWATSTPAGLLIDTAAVSGIIAHGMNDGGAYGGGLFWGPSASDGVEVGDGTTGLGPFGINEYDPAGFPSSDFGFQITCGSKCTNNSTYFHAGMVTLTAEETQGPPSAAADSGTPQAGSEAPGPSRSRAIRPQASVRCRRRSAAIP